MQFHPVANIFPMMSADESKALEADIAANGLREAIWTHDNQIIDGRNRYQACAAVGAQPTFRQWNGQGDLVAFVVSLNLKRRHLTPSQLAVVALDIEKYEAEEAKKRQATSTGGINPQLTEKIPEAEKGEAREKAAKLVGTNGHYVSDAKRIEREAPDLLEKVRIGAASITDAKRELKERAREEVREQNRELVATAPPAIITAADARYQTIVIDPPWDWGDEGDVDQFGRGRPTYATMTIEEVAALPVGDLAEKNAHIYLWITNRSLPKGFALLEEWGFRYVTALTWCKPSIGMGNYFRGSTEHVLFGVKGSLSLLRNNVGTWFQAPRAGRHSAKPPEFFQLVEQCSPGPWLEMFAREPRPGWVSWGAEV